MNSDKLLQELKKARTAVEAERDRLDTLADRLDDVIIKAEEDAKDKFRAIIRKNLNLTDNTPAEQRLDEAKRFLQKAKVRYSISSRESESTDRTSLSYYWVISLRVGPKTTRRINREVPKDVLTTLETLCDEDDVLKRWDCEFGVETKTYIFRFDREDKVVRRRIEKAHVEAIKDDRERTRLARRYSRP